MSAFELTPDERAKINDIIDEYVSRIKVFSHKMPKWLEEQTEQENTINRANCIIAIEAVINEGWEQDE